MLNGLFDIYNRLEYLTENGDILPNLKRLVPWEDFRGELEVIYDHERKSNAGRRPFDVVMMFKILILQSLYNLSDDEMEYQIMDRLTFMRFLGLDLDSRVPDAKTIWLFRSKLEEHNSPGNCLTSSMPSLPNPVLWLARDKSLMRQLFACRLSVTPEKKMRLSRQEIRQLKTGVTQRNVRKTRMPVGRRNEARIISVIRIILRSMFSTRSSGITRLRMPLFTTAKCLRTFLMKRIPAGMFMRTALIVPQSMRLI